MKKSAIDAAVPKKERKPAPPTGWERAGLNSIARFLGDYRDWLFADARESRLVNLDCPDPEQRLAAIVLLKRQVAYWRRRYEDLRGRLPEGSPLDTKLLLQSLLDASKSMSPSEQKRAIAPTGAKRRLKWNFIVRGQRIVGCYNWVAERHRGPELRDALCYGESQFSSAVRKQLGARRARSEGGARWFSAADARALLDYRLSTTGKAARPEIAEAIWQSIKGSQTDYLLAMQRMLKKHGAMCAQVVASHSGYVLGGLSLK